MLADSQFSGVGTLQECTSDHQREQHAPSGDRRKYTFLITHVDPFSLGNATTEEIAQRRVHGKREAALTDIAGTGKDEGQQSSRTTRIEALCR